MTATTIPNAAAFTDDTSPRPPREQTAYLIRMDLVVEAPNSGTALRRLLAVLDHPDVGRVLELCIDDAVPGILST